MRLVNRIFYTLSLALLMALGSCVESSEMSFSEVEKIAMSAWIEQNRPDLLDNYQPIGEYYVEMLDEGVADSVPVRYSDTWLWFDITCRDLAGNVVLTRQSDLAQLQGTYTSHTHYVPYFLYCGNDESAIAIPEGTYLALRNPLKIGDREVMARYGTKMRLYLPSSVGAGDKTMGGDGGYEGQYILNANRPMVVDIQVWGKVPNPVAYEDRWLTAFANVNGGVAPKKENDKEKSAMRRAHISTRTDKDEQVVYDDKWHLAVDSIAALYINYSYTPKKDLNFDCIASDTMLYKGQTAYAKGKVYGEKTLADINREVNEALIKRFGEGLDPAEAEPIDSVETAKVWYVTRLLDGFIIDSNIPEVKRIVYDDVDDDEKGEALDFYTAKGSTANKYVDAWKYALPQMKLGAWNAIITGSSNAYGATGVSGTTSTSSSGGYNDYYNYYNYYNSYYGNSYYNNYYNNYYGYGGYGYDDYYYNNYYNSYYYNSYYNNSYGTETETTTTITSEVQPYAPMMWQIFIEARTKKQ